MFTSVLNIGFIVAISVYAYVKYGEFLERDALFMIPVWWACTIILPSAFARLITQINGD